MQPKNILADLQQLSELAHAATIPISAGCASTPISSNDNTGFAILLAVSAVRKNRLRDVDVTIAGWIPMSAARATSPAIELVSELNNSGGSATSNGPRPCST